MPDYADSYEDVSMFSLSEHRERALLDAQTECCFMWTTKAGDPMGVIMNYVVENDRFWVTCTRRRKRVAAVEARPGWPSPSPAEARTSARARPSLTRGRPSSTTTRRRESWFYPASAARRASRERRPAGGVRRATWPRTGSVVIEIVPDTRIGFDAEEMFRDSPAGPSRTKV